MPVSPRPEEFPLERALAFGRRLAESRKKAGYGSQTALARACNLHPLTVHKHEKQGFMPSRPVVGLYSRVLGVTEAYLLYGTDDPLLDLPEVVRDYLLSPHGQSLSPDTFSRMSRLPWDLLTGEYLDAAMVHELRLLVEKNVALSPQSPDAHRSRPARRGSPFQLPLPRLSPSREAPAA